VRLLVLSSHFQGIINNLIHRGFFEAFPGHVTWFGPGEQLDPAKERLGQVIHRLKPDLVVVNMKKRVVGWLPPHQIAEIEVPKAIVEVDYYVETSDQWYRDCRFDWVFFRSYMDARSNSLKNACWLPFSIHPDWLVFPQQKDGRKLLVTYAGNKSRPELYPVRTKALKVLWREKLIEEPVMPRYHMEYMKWWRQYLAGLTCGSMFHSTNAKHLIIPAAGAALLTDGPPGIELLFPDPHTYWRYRPDCSDLVGVARSILDDPARAWVARRKMHDVLKARHTHAARWAELLATMGLTTMLPEVPHA